LIALLHLLHSPLRPPVRLGRDDPQEKVKTKLPKSKYDPATVVPMPLLPLLLSLADKYALSDNIVDALHVHLLAHAPTDPLKVYGLATLYEQRNIASQASQYLLPMAWYSSQDIKAIPSAVAYHDLVRLQKFRVKSLQAILLHEDLFPHGYGSCPSHHHEATSIWNSMRLALASDIETHTDVAGEMEILIHEFHRCKACHKACTAAVEMLAYKCRRVPRRLDQLPTDI